MEKHRVSEVTEQRFCDQARAIRKNGWLSDLEVGHTHRKIDTESQQTKVLNMCKRTK